MFTFFSSSLCFISGFIIGIFLLTLGQEARKKAEQSEWPPRRDI